MHLLIHSIHAGDDHRCGRRERLQHVAGRHFGHAGAARDGHPERGPPRDDPEEDHVAAGGRGAAHRSDPQLGRLQRHALHAGHRRTHEISLET